MLYEGGIRVPLLVKWPGVSKPSVCKEVVIGVDFFPTLAELTGAKLPKDQPRDGLSIAPLLRDPTSKLERDAVYWHFPAYLQGKGDPMGGPFRTTPACAIRSGDWKLIEWFETDHRELYNLKDDISESRELSESHPEKLRYLQERLATWRKSINAPVPTQLNPRYVAK